MENYKNVMKGRKFYPYADTELYWETFEPDELMAFAKMPDIPLYFVRKAKYIYRRMVLYYIVCAENEHFARYAFLLKTI